MNDAIHRERRGAVALLTIDNPPVNAISVAVVTGLRDAMAALGSDESVHAIVITGAGRAFVAGADIREFGKPRPADAPTLPEVIDAIESSDKPVVAAINGVAAGGGLEIALGCHYRVAAPAARLGLPEVTLGLIPGAGGTQRLPRLIGVESALDLIVAGRLVPAARAEALGIVDAVAEDTVAAAVRLAETVVAEGRAPRRIRDMDDKLAAARGKPEIFDTIRARIARRARGFEAPYACIESIANAVALPFGEAMAAEREIFKRCVDSEQSAAQRHVFFAEREVGKIPGIAKDTPIRPIAGAGIVGCGTMGGGIAMNFLNAGIPVCVLETSQEALDRGLGIIRDNYAATVAKGRLSQADMDARMARLTGTLDNADLGAADIVVEAAFESLDVKRSVFETLDQVCKPEAILATNTSTLDVDAIAAVTRRPDKVIGTHFFSPANVMRLLETVRGAETSDETIMTVMKLARKIGKVAVLVGICDGFVGNRMYYAYTRQANFLLEEGALPHQVDKVLYEFGFPMGPFAVGDLAGLDIGWQVRKAREAANPTTRRYSPIADRICERGRFGQKTGAGWYRYEKGSRTPIPDPEIEDLIVAVSKELGITRREIGEQEILERCLYPLINEGAKILEEGIALRSLDIDIVWIYGYGFPRYRGGPMYYADQIGLGTIYDAMCRLHEAHGDWLEPAPLLAELARSGGSFGAWRRDATG